MSTTATATLDLKNKLADARIRVHVLERELRTAQVTEARLEAEYERATEAGKADTLRPPAPEVSK
jgi:hypothetical protein